MAHPSLSFSNSPSVPEPPPHLPQGPAQPGSQGRPNDDPREAVARLRVEITRSHWDVNASLQRIAEMARSVTEANGAAIALRDGNDIICEGRAGAMAPPLGAKLDADTGISGECLRSGRPVRCEDTTKDARVDPQVREYLGLWSLAAVPVFAGTEVIGVLEVFSALPYSFSLPHLELLHELAELIVAVQHGPEQERAAQVARGSASVAVRTAPGAPEAVSSSGWHRIRRVVKREREMLLHFARTKSGRRKLAVSAMAAMTISLGLGWIWGHTGTTQTPQPLRASKPLKAVGTGASDASMSLAWGSTSLTYRATDRRTSSSPLLIAGKREKLDNKSTNRLTVRPELKSVPTNVPRGEDQLSGSKAKAEVAAETAPALARVPSGSESPLGTVLAMPTAMPAAAMNVSGGLTQGVVVHRVQPVYPPQARTMRLEGTVLLHATVAEDGTVHDIAVSSGPPLLARAAENAVARWRYRPFLLNGKPIAMRTEITLDFKLPSQ
jgi:TonB family protein